MAILITKYKTGVDFPPLRTGLTHEVGENTSTFLTKLGTNRVTSAVQQGFTYSDQRRCAYTDR